MTKLIHSNHAFTALKMTLIGLVLGSGMFLTGCQTTTPTTHAMETSAIQCDMCKTTWVKDTRGGGRNGTIAYSSKQMECSACQGAAKSFFDTGNLQNMCKSCGGTLTVCTSMVK